jgi:osmotically-inducible protein OsmY
MSTLLYSLPQLQADEARGIQAARNWGGVRHPTRGSTNNLDAALISNGNKNGIGHSVKNGVATLSGTVDSESQRAQLATIAQGVPNTQQVVNEIQTRHSKATSN